MSHNNKKSEKIVLTSGFYNCYHLGHRDLFRAAAQLGDTLIVIVNNDYQVKLKGSIPFMDEEERLEIIRSIRYVDGAILSIDSDLTVCKSLELIRPQIFAKGGDRDSDKNMPETEVTLCKELGCEIVYGVGGFNKKQSSSELLRNLKKLDI